MNQSKKVETFLVCQPRKHWQIFQRGDESVSVVFVFVFVFLDDELRRDRLRVCFAGGYAPIPLVELNLVIALCDSPFTG